MRIDYLKINGFGKIENKEVHFGKNINLVYGKNENGKTTLLKSILAMFYGISKNKNGKEISDFDRYKPWKSLEFSGKIKYYLDSGKAIEVFRDFAKKSPKIFDENSEDISKEFNIDKNRGNEFFYEQTKIDEEMFIATGLVEQQGVVLENKDKTILTQKIANILSTGENNISYKKTIEKLNKELIEKVGTDRTVDRPINIVEEEIEHIEKEKKLLKDKEIIREDVKQEKQEILEKINQQEHLLKLLKEIKIIKEKEALDQEKLKIKSTIVSEYKQKIEELQKNKGTKEKKKGIQSLVFVIILIITIALFISNKVFGIAMLTAIIIAYFLIFVIQKRKTQQEKNLVKKEIKILEKNIEEKEEEIVHEKQLLYKTIEAKENELTKKEDAKTIAETFAKNFKEIEEQIYEVEKNLGDLKVNLNTIQIEEKNILKDLEYKAELEEKLQKNLEIKQELQNEERRIKLAKQALEKAYKRMENQITPKFTTNLSDIASKISNGKYKNIKFTEKEGIFVELENGEYINCTRLSIGTIDQLYLSLRLSVFQEIVQEKIPIILDEAFAYYDKERLENILQYLNDNFQEHQIIIFTCTEREKEIFQKLNIKYNLIEL